MTHLVPALRPVLGSPFRRAELYRRAGELPSFHINPAALGHARDLITGTVLGGGTVNSATPAWEVGPGGILAQPAANTPVIAYDPVTLRPLGLRVWQGVTNLALNSNTFQPSSAGNPAAYVIDQLSPTGANNASRQTAASPRTFIDYSGIPNGAYTVSFWCRVMSGTSAFEIFIKNAASDTVVASDTTPVATTTWKRFSISGTTTGATTGLRLELAGVVSGFVFFGVQVQTGSTVGPYVPTTTITASSTADVLSITGSDFTRIVNSTEGTIYIEYGPHTSVTGTNNCLWALQATSDSDVDLADAFVGGNGLVPVFRVNSNSVNQAYITSTVYNASSIHRMASAYAVNNFARSLDLQGVSVDTLGSLLLNSPTRLEIGSVSAYGVTPLNGYIRELAIFRSRLPNANLEALTS